MENTKSLYIVIARETKYNLSKDFNKKTLIDFFFNAIPDNHSACIEIICSFSLKFTLVCFLALSRRVESNFHFI